MTFLERKGWKPKNALDLGCGTGVLCEILHESGISAAGMDFSSGMITIARERNSQIRYEVGDMVTYRPEKCYDLVTCTGDSLNHIRELNRVEQIFRNVYGYLAEGGYFIFDILNRNEVSTSEPFEMEMEDGLRVWFQMTTPGEDEVNLKIQVFRGDVLEFEENIRETVHDPEEICAMLKQAGFTVERCADRLLDDGGHGTTWFVVAAK